MERLMDKVMQAPPCQARIRVLEDLGRRTSCLGCQYSWMRTVYWRANVAKSSMFDWSQLDNENIANKSSGTTTNENKEAELENRFPASEISQKPRHGTPLGESLSMSRIALPRRKIWS
jgi:hypothetical protein